ncbi:MGMT family protein [Solitalea sp. MAHUQ-68]|uniref:MGMT family protein n=1 Tax=Solitalea agri TaxID=2953739 RepID=A0A9X2F2K1_9SPHI|nr:MGMT family protein [Solitalea agri]MCO4293010.1 MGMT family protein [Solitalea agri]
MKDPNFFEKVFDVVRMIPPGRVTSYGAIANFLGTRGSSRMVGWAMHAASSAIPPIPAHRVVNSAGLLTGKVHFGTPTLMEELLASEGIMVYNDKIQSFKKHFWDPSVELK